MLAFYHLNHLVFRLTNVATAEDTIHPLITDHDALDNASLFKASQLDAFCHRP